MKTLIIGILLIILCSCDQKNCKECEKWGTWADSTFLMDEAFFCGKYQPTEGYDFMWHDGHMVADTNGKFINVPYTLKNCKPIYCN